ncbi:MAG TPA: phosphonate dehydrogenase [Planctomycetota bacterium]|nr:phosphonate dehydrogenase [Planctomycetota bacterium]
MARSGPPRIVLTHWVHDEVLEYLGSHGEVIPNPNRTSLLRQELLERARLAEALMAFMPDRVDETLLGCCPRLKIVAGAFKGADNVDLETCSRRGIWVSIVPDLLTGPTAELAVGLLLSLIRKIVPGDAVVRSAAFSGWRPILYGGTLQEKSVGILGMGLLGQAIARRLRGFDVELRYSDPRRLDPERERELGARHASFEELLESSDALILAAPLTQQTFHKFDRAALATLRPWSVLVNVGRGSVVDEEAVADALSRGALGGYASDVFEMEDLSRPDRPRGIPEALLQYGERTVFTPHLGSAVDATRREIEMVAARNIVDVLEGRRPRDGVNLPVVPVGL